MMSNEFYYAVYRTDTDEFMYFILESRMDSQSYVVRWSDELDPAELRVGMWVWPDKVDEILADCPELRELPVYFVPVVIVDNPTGGESDVKIDWSNWVPIAYV